MKLLVFLGLLVLGALLKPGATDDVPGADQTNPTTTKNSTTNPLTTRTSTAAAAPSATPVMTNIPTTTDSSVTVTPTTTPTTPTTDSSPSQTNKSSSLIPTTTDSSVTMTPTTTPTTITADSSPSQTNKSSSPIPTTTDSSVTMTPTTTPTTITTDSSPSQTNKSSSPIPTTTDSIVTMTPTTTPTTITTDSSPSPTPTGTTPVHPSTVIISETNLLLADDQLFVELAGKKTDTLADLELVILNASSAAVVKTFSFDEDDNTGAPFTNGVYVQPIDKELVENLMSVAVVLKTKATAGGSSWLKGMQDFVVLATGDAALNPSVKEALLRNNTPPLVSKSLGGPSVNLSLSRFMNTVKDNSAFVVSAETQGAVNSISLTQTITGLTLQLHSTEEDSCKGSQDTSPSVRTKLCNQLVAEVNRLCKCGLSVYQISGSLHCLRDLFLNFNVSESYPQQGFATTFSTFVQSTMPLRVGTNQYSVVNCTHDCQKTTPHSFPPGNNPGKGNIKVTVAVVLSCIVVFLFILIAVIFYMRKKQQGIMRQFRMTRLQEDDDLEDMDDFIGGYDQEPSFSSSRSNLTTN